MDKVKSIFTVLFKVSQICLLIAITVLLFNIYMNMPAKSITLNDLISKKADIKNIPVIRVQSGSINVNNTVDVSGRVEVDGGHVSIRDW